MNARIFWTNAPLVWVAVASLAYTFAGGVTPEFFFWVFVLAMLALPLLIATSLEQRR